MQIQGMRKELRALKKEFVREFRPIEVLLRTKAADMTATEIDRLVQEVPVNRIPTDVLISYLDRDIGDINEYLRTSFNSVADMPIGMYEKMTERWKNEPASIEKGTKQIKENVKSHTPRNMLADIPLTDEIVRCCHEFIRAKAEAWQRLIDSGISGSELKECKRDNYICDPLVMKAHHNKLIAITNARTPGMEPRKIEYLFDMESQEGMV